VNYTKNKDLNKYIKSLEKEGWVVEHSKHLKLRCPTGGVVSCSYSPSCPFVVDKVKSDVKRLQRKNEEKYQFVGEV
jgi:hypothetical protein